MIVVLTAEERDTLHRLNMRNIRRQWRSERAKKSALHRRIVDRIIEEREASHA